MKCLQNINNDIPVKLVAEWVSRLTLQHYVAFPSISRCQCLCHMLPFKDSLKQAGKGFANGSHCHTTNNAVGIEKELTGCFKLLNKADCSRETTDVRHFCSHCAYSSFLDTARWAKWLSVREWSSTGHGTPTESTPVVSSTSYSLL